VGSTCSEGSTALRAFRAWRTWRTGRTCLAAIAAVGLAAASGVVASEDARSPGRPHAGGADGRGGSHSAPSAGSDRSEPPRSEPSGRTAAVPRVRVLLIEGDGPLVLSRQRAPGAPDPSRAIRAIRVEAGSQGLVVDGTATGRRWRAGDAAVWRIATGGRAASRRTRGGDALHVRGRVEVLHRAWPTGEPSGPASGAAGGWIVVNELPVEDFVAGSVGSEMPSAWAPEALRAQAVVIRTYALHRRRARADEAWHLRADTSGVVYGGVDAETPEVWQAVAATRGEFLAFGDAPILAAFHSTAGGHTASAEEVWGRPVAYLVGVPVEGEDISPYTYWRTQVTAEELGRALARQGFGVGAPRRMRVLRRSASGRVAELEVQGPDGSARLSGRALRRALGEDVLRSTAFQVRTAPGGRFVFAGTGHGHGVGLSQWGARALAAGGSGYREILRSFYPGTELQRLGGGRRSMLREGT